MATNGEEVASSERKAADEVRVCCGGDCMARRSEELLTVLEEKYKNDPSVSVATCRCTGYCSIGPNVDVNGNIVHHNSSRNVVEQVEHARTLPPQQGMVTDAAIDFIIQREDLF
jgi:NADH:ubiquinone oxidoreductase subunit E